MFLEPFLRLHSVTWCIILLKDAIPAREDSCHKGVYLVQHNVKASVTLSKFVQQEWWIQVLSKKILLKQAHSLHLPRCIQVRRYPWVNTAQVLACSHGVNKTWDLSDHVTHFQSSTVQCLLHAHCMYWRQWTTLSIGIWMGVWLQIHIQEHTINNVFGHTEPINMTEIIISSMVSLLMLWTRRDRLRSPQASMRHD